MHLILPPVVNSVTGKARLYGKVNVFKNIY